MCVGAFPTCLCTAFVQGLGGRKRSPGTGAADGCEVTRGDGIELGPLLGQPVLLTSELLPLYTSVFGVPFASVFRTPHSAFVSDCFLIIALRFNISWQIIVLFFNN